MLYKTIQTSNTEDIDEFLNDKRIIVCDINLSSCGSIWKDQYDRSWDIVMTTVIISYEEVPQNTEGV